MSNSLAIATITAVLETRLEALLSRNGLNGLGVTSAHPNNNPSPGIYIQLYRIAPNLSGYTQDLPTRRSQSAAVVTTPQLIIDLNYLFTFVGDANTYDTERLAGLVMTEFHTRPILSRQEVGSYVDSLNGGDVLSDTDLADQASPVRLTLLPQTTEDMTRIWGLLNQSYYGLSVTYQAGPVTLEQALQPTTALPVTQPSLQTIALTAPKITTLRTPERNQPIVEIGQALIIQGRDLAGESTWLRLGSQLIEVPAGDLRGDEITLPITPALGLAPGAISLQVVHQVPVRTSPAVEYRIAAQSNTAVFALLPTVSLSSNTLNAADNPMTLSLSVSPTPSANQPVELLLDEDSDNGQHRVVTEWQLVGNTVEFTFESLPVGRWIVRLRVNGVLSLLQPNGSGDLGPAVTVS